MPMSWVRSTHRTGINVIAFLLICLTQTSLMHPAYRCQNIALSDCFYYQFLIYFLNCCVLGRPRLIQSSKSSTPISMHSPHLQDSFCKWLHAMTAFSLNSTLLIQWLIRWASYPRTANLQARSWRGEGVNTLPNKWSNEPTFPLGIWLAMWEGSAQLR